MRKEDLPKYVRIRRNTALQYRRRYEGIKDSKALFTRAMKSKLSDDASQVQAEAAQMTKLYELELKKRTTAHPDAFTDAEIDTLAVALLKDRSRQFGADIGKGFLYPPRTDSFEVTDWDGTPTGEIREEPISEFIADELSGLDEFIETAAERRGKSTPPTLAELTPEERLQHRVILRVKEALLKKRRQPPRYLSECFHWYAKNRKRGNEWETEGPDWIRRYTRFCEILQFIGDRQTDEANVDLRISEGFEAYAEEMVERGKKGQTIKRDLAEIGGCFNRVSEYFKLRWNIEKPEYTPSPVKEKSPLQVEEQEAFVKSCLAKYDGKAAVLLAMFQGGMMPSEVRRLANDFDNAVVMTGPIPYITLKEETKTGEVRRRLIPIVLGIDLLASKLREGVNWLNSGLNPSTPSQTLGKRLTVATGNPALSTHCLRHTWELLANEADISLTHQAYIGGWSSADKRAKFSPQILRYGATGIQRHKMVQALQESQRLVFADLMHFENRKSAKVVQLNRK